jgi:hypothetical protein
MAGAGFVNSPWTTEKMVVLPPITSAIRTTALRAMPGDR